MDSAAAALLYVFELVAWADDGAVGVAGDLNAIRRTRAVEYIIGNDDAVCSFVIVSTHTYTSFVTTSAGGECVPIYNCVLVYVLRRKNTQGAGEYIISKLDMQSRCA